MSLCSLFPLGDFRARDTDRVVLLCRLLRLCNKSSTYTVQTHCSAISSDGHFDFRLFQLSCFAVVVFHFLGWCNTGGLRLAAGTCGARIQEGAARASQRLPCLLTGPKLLAWQCVAAPAVCSGRCHGNGITRLTEPHRGARSSSVSCSSWVPRGLQAPSNVGIRAVRPDLHT